MPTNKTILIRETRNFRIRLLQQALPDRLLRALPYLRRPINLHLSRRRLRLQVITIILQTTQATPPTKQLLVQTIINETPSNDTNKSKTTIMQPTTIKAINFSTNNQYSANTHKIPQQVPQMYVTKLTVSTIKSIIMSAHVHQSHTRFPTESKTFNKERHAAQPSNDARSQ